MLPCDIPNTGSLFTNIAKLNQVLGYLIESGQPVSLNILPQADPGPTEYFTLPLLVPETYLEDR